MAYVRQTNLELWRLNRCALKFSHAYQVRENVVTSTSLFRCFIGLFAQTLLGWTGFVVAFIFRFPCPNQLLYRISIFLYDISTALAPTTIPLFLVLYERKINVAFKKKLNKLLHRKEGNCDLVGLEGNQLQLDAKQETETYFQQLKKAWA
ncbi:hypothetical protein OESDEN_15340 [Oesophagostomum dentatum]|uniref:7TM GPCR serpentine receptor class x (Srx) domain-containing protein n=1 Tax=Oesophagostomum dentatum TaxID=61180 RepID=A0A0B1SNZ6_OESDE|nr:hypothetical protein OESDEN_15340 [Oesophagostomum dentatum]